MKTAFWSTHNLEIRYAWYYMIYFLWISVEFYEIIIHYYLQKVTCKCGLCHHLLEKGNSVVNFIIPFQHKSNSRWHSFWLVTWSHICIILYAFVSAFMHNSLENTPRGESKTGIISIMLQTLYRLLWPNLYRKCFIVKWNWTWQLNMMTFPHFS